MKSNKKKKEIVPLFVMYINCIFFKCVYKYVYIHIYQYFLHTNLGPNYNTLKTELW